MTYTFESLFSAQLHDFVRQKNAVGFSYDESMRLLRDFDRFCHERFPDESSLHGLFGKAPRVTTPFAID